MNAENFDEHSVQHAESDHQQNRKEKLLNKVQGLLANSRERYASSMGSAMERRADTLERRLEIAEYAAGLVTQHLHVDRENIPENHAPTPSDISKREARKLSGIEKAAHKQKVKQSQEEWKQKVVGDTKHYSGRKTRKMRRDTKKSVREAVLSGNMSVTEAALEIRTSKISHVGEKHTQDKIKKKIRKSKESLRRHSDSLRPDSVLESTKKLGEVTAETRIARLRNASVTEVIQDFQTSQEQSVRSEHKTEQRQMQRRRKTTEGPSVDRSDLHPRIDDAKKVVAHLQQASPSILMSHLNISIEDGRRIINEMLDLGYLTPSTAGHKFPPRVLLPKPEQIPKIKKSEDVELIEAIAKMSDSEKAELLRVDGQVYDEIAASKANDKTWEGLSTAEIKERQAEIRNDVYRQNWPNITESEARKKFMLIMKLTELDNS